MADFEDTNPTPTPVEQILIDGVSYPTLNKLLSALKQSITKGPGATVQARAIIVTAHLFEPGDLFVGYFDDEVLSVTFATKSRVLDVDELLKPSYGYVRGAIGELKQARIDPTITDMWLDYFRTDNGLYRVAVTAGMCLTGALLDAGFRVTV